MKIKFKSNYIQHSSHTHLTFVLTRPPALMFHHSNKNLYLLPNPIIISDLEKIIFYEHDLLKLVTCSLKL